MDKIQHGFYEASLDARGSEGVKWGSQWSGLKHFSVLSSFFEGGGVLIKQR